MLWHARMWKSSSNPLTWTWPRWSLGQICERSSSNLFIQFHTCIFSFRALWFCTNMDEPSSGNWLHLIRMLWSTHKCMSANLNTYIPYLYIYIYMHIIFFILNRHVFRNFQTCFNPFHLLRCYLKLGEHRKCIDASLGTIQKPSRSRYFGLS